MSDEPISKLVAARRQLDTAIDLWLNEADSLSIFTLAYCSFKVLMDLDPHHTDGELSAYIDQAIERSIGWKELSSQPNFLKHADRDPHDVLAAFHPDLVMPIIGWAVQIFKGIDQGQMSIKMMGFDIWTDMLGAEAMGLEIHSDPILDQRHKAMARLVNDAPREQRMEWTRKWFANLLPNIAAMKAALDECGPGATEAQAIERAMQIFAKSTP